MGLGRGQHALAPESLEQVRCSAVLGIVGCSTRKGRDRLKHPKHPLVSQLREGSVAVESQEHAS